MVTRATPVRSCAPLRATIGIPRRVERPISPFINRAPRAVRRLRRKRGSSPDSLARLSLPTLALGPARAQRDLTWPATSGATPPSRRSWRAATVARWPARSSGRRSTRDRAGASARPAARGVSRRAPPTAPSRRSAPVPPAAAAVHVLPFGGVRPVLRQSVAPRGAPPRRPPALLAAPPLEECVLPRRPTHAARPRADAPPCPPSAPSRRRWSGRGRTRRRPGARPPGPSRHRSTLVPTLCARARAARHAMRPAAT